MLPDHVKGFFDEDDYHDDIDPRHVVKLSKHIEASITRYFNPFGLLTDVQARWAFHHRKDREHPAFMRYASQYVLQELDAFKTNLETDREDLERDGSAMENT